MNKKTVLKNVFFDGAKRDILIVGNLFEKVTRPLELSDYDGAEIVDCSHFAIMPAFYNGHTHAAMSLLRGFADDMELGKWLREYIWPTEAKLTDADIRVGSRLAVLEMIKSGTVFFADMYWHREQTMRVVEEMGIRAAIGVTFAESLMSPEAWVNNIGFLKNHTGESERVQLVVMPHAIYTVGDKKTAELIELAHSEHYKIHTHLSETMTEIKECEEKYNCTPVVFWQRLGGLDENFSAAHCTHFTASDRKIFAESGATAILNPCSNMKLNSGIPQIAEMLKDGMKLGLGTDGDSSNNNLDMQEEMKTMALLAKYLGTAETLPAEDALKMATCNVAQFFGINAGRIAEGCLADCLLIDMNNERMVPCYNVYSNWVYSANSSAIDSVMCNGNFVMRGRHVDGEEEILRDARECAARLARR
jgi:Cytosine deaminase and related metal-dependent hydrolases